MSSSLASSQIRRFQDHGLVFPIRILSADETRRFRTCCDELEAGLGGKPRTIEVRQMHLHFRWAFELATHPRVLAAVESLLGPHLLIWASELFAKHPFDDSVSIAWHRDRPYMGFVGSGAATAWVALSPSTPANGCMRYRPRTWDRLLPSDDPPPSGQMVDVELAPGEMSLHDADVLHGSSPNRSGEKRVGFVIRFITPEIKPLEGVPPVVLAQGRCRSERFQIVAGPSESDGQTLAAMRRSAAQHFDAVLQNLRVARRHR